MDGALTLPMAVTASTRPADDRRWAEVQVTVEALRRGDVGVLDELLDRFGQELRATAYLILRDRSEAEDIVVETLLSALRRGRALREPASLRPWLLRICVNRSLDRRRRASRIIRLRGLSDRQAQTAGVEVAERLALLEALDALPVRIRAAVVLHHYADLSVADVAATMGTSPNTVTSQLRGALSRLRASLRDDVDRDAAVETSHA
jgi:RNA polymerase sigma-70 factor (ECF subfamily)